MATTYLQALNRVLELIGEDAVPNAATSLTQDYHILVGAFMNDIKEQVEDAHNWRSLRTTTSTTVTGGDSTAAITGADERSRLVRIYQQNACGVVPLVFDTTDAGDPTPLQEIDLSELIYRDTVEPDTRQDPCYFALDNSAGDTLNLMVHPRPSGDRTIQTTLITPQGILSNDSLSTVISVPIRPIITGTVWYCLEERGEELGPNALFSERRFADALNAAIARDSAEQGDNMELVAV
jgi:hypothetical protein